MIPSIVTGEMERLSFDLNVALKGILAENKAYEESRSGNGRITNRFQAKAAAERAKADVYEMEQERLRLRR